MIFSGQVTKKNCGYFFQSWLNLKLVRLRRLLAALGLLTSGVCLEALLAGEANAQRTSPGPPAVPTLADVPGASGLLVGQLPGLERLRLDQVPGALEARIRDLPGLLQVRVGLVPGLAQSLVGCALDDDSCDIGAVARLTLSQAIARGLLPAEFQNLAIGSVEGLGNLVLGQIPGISGLAVGQVAGLVLKPLSQLGLDCWLPQYVDHVNYDYSGFTEFSLPEANRFKVGQEEICNGSLKIRLDRVDEPTGQGFFSLYIRTPCGPFCWFWAGPLPWPTAREASWWLGPRGGHSTLDTAGGGLPPTPGPRPVVPPPQPPRPPGPPPPAPRPQPLYGSKQERIAATAKDQLGKFCTREIPGTQNGNYGCAAAVNGVVQIATGRQVGGGLSTAAMAAALRSKTGTEITQAQARAGDIVISPTVGRNVGHVGICLSTGCGAIGSNSSRAGCFVQNFTLGNWVSYYQNQKGLSVQFFRVK